MPIYKCFWRTIAINEKRPIGRDTTQAKISRDPKPETILLGAPPKSNRGPYRPDPPNRLLHLELQSLEWPPSIADKLLQKMPCTWMPGASVCLRILLLSWDGATIL